MAAAFLITVAQLTRLDRSALLSLLVFFPLWVRTGSSSTAAIHILPLCLGCMAGFLINNLHDIEKDLVNHPNRPLPRGTISLQTSAAIFFAILTTFLIIVRTLIAEELAFWYVVGVLFFINYNYIVAYLWPLKNLYAGALPVLPILVLARVSPDSRFLPIMIAVLLHATGTELLSDVKDRKGDGSTLAKWIGTDKALAAGLSLKVVGILVLLSVVESVSDALIVAALASSEVIFLMLWRRGANMAMLLRTSLVQAVAGSYLLY